MALLKKTRSAQYSLWASFTWNFGDTMVDKDGATKDFKSFGAPFIGDVIPLPPGAVVIGGEVVTETAIATSTAYNISVGDSGLATRFLGITDRVAAGRTALVPTGFHGVGNDIRLTVTPTVADATAGKVTLRVNYVVDGRCNENQIS